jgi:hypothetical protein
MFFARLRLAALVLMSAAGSEDAPPTAGRADNALPTKRDRLPEDAKLWALGALNTTSLLLAHDKAPTSTMIEIVTCQHLCVALMWQPQPLAFGGTAMRTTMPQRTLSPNTFEIK